MNKNTCPVCKNEGTKLFLKRDNVPVHQNLIYTDQTSAKELTRGNLSLYVCSSCGFIYNQEFDSSKLAYGDEYDNTQCYSGEFNVYLDNLVTSLVNEKGIKDSRIVEVGCGKGHFIKKLIENPTWNNTGIGYDPSYVGPKSCFNGNLLFENTYFGNENAEQQADVIICRHVIEHIKDPVDFLKIIRRTIINSPNARVFFETPCVKWILENAVIWDFFYEHCSYFTKESLTTAFNKAGFIVEDITYLFGGQYMWLEAKLALHHNEVSKSPNDIAELASKYANAESEHINYWKNKLATLRMDGKIAIWGAGAKGVTFVNLVDTERELIECVVDINPNKQGNYIAGSGHPIVTYHEIKDRAVKTVIVLNPNYYDEVMQLLIEHNIKVNLINGDAYENNY